MKKFNAITYLHFSKILFMKNNFANCNAATKKSATLP